MRHPRTLKFWCLAQVSKYLAKIQIISHLKEFNQNKTKGASRLFNRKEERNDIDRRIASEGLPFFFRSRVVVFLSPIEML